MSLRRSVDFPSALGQLTDIFAYISTTGMCQGLLQSKGFSFCHHAICSRPPLLLYQHLYGWPGSVHDARVFKNSDLYRKGENGSLDPTTGKIINGVKAPLVVLGDPACPLLPWLMKPYTDNGRLTPAAKPCNYRLSRGRIVVENAFDRLKGQWRYLLKRNDAQVQHIPHVIAACVTLHNICEIHKEHFHDEWLTSNHNDTLPATEQHNTVHRSDPTAEAIRGALRDYVIVLGGMGISIPVYRYG